MRPKAKILYLEDSQDIKENFEDSLKKFSCEITSVNNIKDLADQWNKAYDIALLDLKVPLGESDFEEPFAENTIKFLKDNKGHYLIKKTIVYTVSPTQNNFDTLDELHSFGVDRIIFKDQPNWIQIILDEIETLIKNIIIFQGEENYTSITKFIKNYKKDMLIYRSNEMQKILKTINENINSNFILSGESGTGKTLLAKEIHRRYKEHLQKTDKNAKVPFVEISSDNLKDDSLRFDARLYGYKKGAFTGANETKKGLLSYANNGVLLLDEFLEMPLSSQGRLRSFIQNKEFTMIGKDGLEDVVKVNCKIIAATNKNIEETLRKDMFRNDLYQRLKLGAVHCELPSLNNRKEDIPFLIDYYIQNMNDESEKELKIKWIDKEINEILNKTNWKNENVRGLYYNIHLAYLYAISDGRDFIDKKDIIKSINEQIKINDLEYEHLIEDIICYADRLYLDHSNIKFSKQLIEDLVKSACLKFDVKRVEKMLGISRSKIYEILKK